MAGGARQEGKEEEDEEEIKQKTAVAEAVDRLGSRGECGVVREAERAPRFEWAKSPRPPRKGELSPGLLVPDV